MEQRREINEKNEGSDGGCRGADEGDGKRLLIFLRGEGKDERCSEKGEGREGGRGRQMVPVEEGGRPGGAGKSKNIVGV